MLGSAELWLLFWSWQWKSIQLGICSCFFPLLPLLKHLVPSSSHLCRQTGSAPQGDVKSHLSSVCDALRLGPAAAQICLAEPDQGG